MLALARSERDVCGHARLSRTSVATNRNLLVFGRFQLKISAETSSKLVDSARSHMLVSKIKPCMCKFTLINSKTADGSLQQY